MKLILFLAIRNAARNVTRTLLTASMVVLGVALMVVMLTWIDGVMGSMMSDGADSLGHVRVVTQAYAEREELFPIYENIADTEPVVAAAKGLPHVIGAWPRIATGVTLTVTDEIGDTFGMAVGADPEAYEVGLHLKDRLVEGTWFTGAADEVVLGRKLVTQTGAKLGDDVLLLGATQDGAPGAIEAKLVGVVAAGSPVIDQQAFLSLDQLRYLTDIPDGAVEVLVYVDDIDRASEVAAALQALPQSEGLVATAWDAREPLASMMPMVAVMKGFISSVVVFITALGVWNTMLMSVLERTDEIGVMRAMGLGRVGAVVIFVVEAIVIAVIGGTFGVLLGSVGGYYIETIGMTLGDQVTSSMDMPIVMPQTLHGDLTLGGVVTAFGIGLVMAVLGSALPAIRAASIQPVTAMRSGR